MHGRQHLPVGGSLPFGGRQHLDGADGYDKTRDPSNHFPRDQVITLTFGRSLEDRLKN
jgi:hypothetical protein